MDIDSISCDDKAHIPNLSKTADENTSLWQHSVKCGKRLNGLKSGLVFKKWVNTKKESNTALSI